MTLHVKIKFISKLLLCGNLSAEGVKYWLQLQDSRFDLSPANADLSRRLSERRDG